MADTELRLIEKAVLDVVLSREGRRRYNNGDSLTLDPSDLRDIVRLTVDKCAALASRPAEVDDEGLPPLPESKFCQWLQHGQVVNAFTHGVGDKARWDHDGHWAAKGYDRAPLYTIEQYRQGQRDAVAADRARREKGSEI